MHIFKICTREVWEETERAGVFPGMQIDLADGYVHLSSLEQSGATIRKYFRGQTGLVMLTVDADKLGDALRWEQSSTGRRGEFPHLYGSLPLSAIIEAMPFDAPD